MFKKALIISILAIISIQVYALDSGDNQHNPPKVERNKVLEQIVKNNDEYTNAVASLFKGKPKEEVKKVEDDKTSIEASNRLQNIFEAGAKEYIKLQEEQELQNKKANSRYSISADSNLTNKESYITAEDMNTIISHFEKFNGGSPFHNQGEIFIEASKESGLDPIYILAHASWESDWGRSYLARDRGNYFGINAIDANPNAAHTMGNSMADGIINGAVWISKNYYQEGQTTLNSMIYGKKQYAKAADKWINGVSSIMNESYSVLRRSRNL